MQGIHAILVTPFLPGGTLDLESLRHLVAFVAKTGVHGIAVLGVQGEVQKLDDAERIAIVETVAEAAAAADLALTVGVSHGGAKVAARFARQAEEAGAAAVMLAPPPLVATGPGLLTFFQQVADAVNIPIILQDYPQATGVVMPLPFLVEVAERVPNVSAIKCEDAPTPSKIAAIQQAVGSRFVLLGGLGGLYFLEELHCRASGTLTGFAYPEILRKVYDAHVAGDQQGAAAIFASATPLIRFEAQAGVGLGIRKAILRRRGAIAHATMRVPYTAVNAATLMELDLWLAYLKERGVIEADEATRTD